MQPRPSRKTALAAALTIALMGTLTAGCSVQMPAAPDAGNPPADTGGDGSSAEMPESPSPEALFARITQDDPFRDWAQFPEAQGVIPSAPPHGPSSQTFINTQVESAIASFDGALPDDSIIVKENLGTGEGPESGSLTIMWKVQGFDPENNDWFWANITADGDVQASGSIATCIACHLGARSNDFVFLHSF